MLIFCACIFTGAYRKHTFCKQDAIQGENKFHNWMLCRNIINNDKNNYFNNIQGCFDFLYFLHE